MYQTTLVPTDGSEASITAAEEALEITASDGVIHALGVLEELPTYTRSGKAQKFDEDGKQRSQLEDATSRVEALAETGGTDVVTAIEEGVPSREIVSYADAAEVDVIVVGKRGQSAAAEDLLGSTTERVVRDASTTVVSVPGAD